MLFSVPLGCCSSDALSSKCQDLRSITVLTNNTASREREASDGGPPDHSTSRRASSSADSSREHLIGQKVEKWEV
jgi:hypothetical protein